MLTLPKPGIDILNQYCRMIIDSVIQNRDMRNDDVAKYLTKDKLKEIILGEPKALYDKHIEFLNFFFTPNGLKRYESYLKASRKQPRNRNYLEKQLVNDFGPIIGRLKNIFDYTGIISSKKDISYQLSKLLNRNTCTYCNRQYTLTISEASDHIIRPQFDHWFLQSKYPLLALSFFNLIPCCSYCNSSTRGAVDFTLGNYCHPYVDMDIENSVSFSYKKKDVHDNNLVLNTANEKIKKVIKAFRIHEIYDGHSQYELKDLIELRYKYSENYLDTLIHSTFKEIDLTIEEAYRLVFGIESQTTNFHKRPLSKFKKDIIEELLRS